MPDTRGESERAKRATPVERLSLEAAIVAHRFYIDGRQKGVIAAELGISRFKVARLIDEARANGLIRLNIDLPAMLDLAAGERLAKKFGIRRCIVAVAHTRATDLIDVQLGGLAAQYLGTRVSSADVLGVAWGTTLAHMVDAHPGFPPCELVQLMGGVSAATIEVNGMELVRRLGQQTGSSMHVLHAPILVDSEATALHLRQDASLAGTINRFKTVTVAVVGIGSWSSGRSWFFQEMREQDRKKLVEVGAEADICTVLLDSEGESIFARVLDRTISIKINELRAIPEVIAVAGGEEKTSAIAAALRSGLVHTLITDSITARALLTDP